MEEEENFSSHNEVFGNQIVDVDSSKPVRTYKLLSTTSDNSINIIVSFYCEDFENWVVNEDIEEIFIHGNNTQYSNI